MVEAIGEGVDEGLELVDAVWQNSYRQLGWARDRGAIEIGPFGRQDDEVEPCRAAMVIEGRPELRSSRL